LLTDAMCLEYQPKPNAWPGAVRGPGTTHAVGVAPNVTLVPVKVCDATGYCYASPVVDGITHSATSSSTSST
jgi:hypothetical protein